MADVPPEMMTKDRKPDPVFKDDEDLYRRFKPEDIDGARVSVDALELPDMSVNRSKYGPAKWLLLDEEYADWGVFAFRVGDLPRELLHNAVQLYRFDPRHVPHKFNYPHSEVWVFLDDKHIDAKTEFLLDPDLHQRWRQKLIWKSRIVIHPNVAG
jgi:hypothetical protein